MSARRPGQRTQEDEVLLVIGIHREELPFGERVAEQLAADDRVPDLQVLRIPEGISGRHPRADQRYHYEVQHRELYRQIREVAHRHRLIIDLHRGEDDGGPCADVICANAELLNCVLDRWSCSGQAECGAQREPVRAVRLATHGQEPAEGEVAGRTVIPRDVWNSATYLFVGLEVFAPTAGGGQPQDWRLAAGLIASIVECAEHLSPVSAAKE